MSGKWEVAGKGKKAPLSKKASKKQKKELPPVAVEEETVENFAISSELLVTLRYLPTCIRLNNFFSIPKFYCLIFQPLSSCIFSFIGIWGFGGIIWSVFRTIH